MDDVDAEKMRIRVIELMKLINPSIEEIVEMENILNSASHPRTTDLKIGILKTHYKLKLKTEAAEFHRYKDQYYFLELVYLRMDELKEAKSLSAKDCKDLVRISRLNILSYIHNLLQHRLIKQFINDLGVEDQISICIDWINRPRYKQAAILLSFKSDNAIIMKSEFLKEQIRLLAGNHLYKREYSCTILICHQLNANFHKISKQYRNMLVESLLKRMNSNTERAARQLFGQKFNFIPVSLRNKILTSILNSEELPNYFVKSFLLSKYQNVTELNYRLIEKTLRER